MDQPEAAPRRCECSDVYERRNADQTLSLKVKGKPRCRKCQGAGHIITCATCNGCGLVAGALCPKCCGSGALGTVVETVHQKRTALR